MILLVRHISIIFIDRGSETTFLISINDRFETDRKGNTQFSMYMKPVFSKAGVVFVVKRLKITLNVLHFTKKDVMQCFVSARDKEKFMAIDESTVICKTL